MERKLLTPDEITTALDGLEGWAVGEYVLKRRVEFDDFAGALAFVNRVGEIAESLDHHPDISFGWGYANISTTTHDRGGITEFDLALARSINELKGN